jgi:hypothetical protein
MATACECDQTAAEQIVEIVRELLEILPDVDPERLAAARAMLANGLPAASAIASAIVDDATAEVATRHAAA